MTAPMVVAHWINMQYYASVVDHEHFGSGFKTLHNVVGEFGIYSGNGGDLQTGLPWESVYDGSDYRHKPLRLLAIIAAPISRVSAILSKHDELEQLLANGWLHLVVVDGERFYRYGANESWETIGAEQQAEMAAM